MEAIGYIRVSTTGQATDGVSLSAQRQRITAWCLATGYELIAVHVDAGVSGAKASNRPGLHAALAEAKQTKAALVIYSLSLLARSTRDAIECDTSAPGASTAAVKRRTVGACDEMVSVWLRTHRSKQWLTAPER
jgi:hypothetical protein